MASNFLESIANLETDELTNDLKDGGFTLIARLVHPQTGNQRLDSEGYKIITFSGFNGYDDYVSGDDLAMIDCIVNGELPVFYKIESNIKIFSIYEKRI